MEQILYSYGDIVYSLTGMQSHLHDSSFHKPYPQPLEGAEQED